MKPWIGASIGLSHWARLASIGVLTLCAAPQAALAQYYFRPYGQLIHQPIEEAPRFAARRSIAAIMASEGFRLVGPLGERGDNIVATGVDARGRWMRFVIDPYEGEVLGAKFIVAPAPAEGADPDASAGRKPAVIGAPTGKPAPAPARGFSHRAITPPPSTTTTTAAPVAPDAKTTTAAPAAPTSPAAPDATATIPAPVAPAATTPIAAPVAPAEVAAGAGPILPPIASSSPLLDVTHAEAARRQPAPEKTPEATPASAQHDGG